MNTIDAQYLPMLAAFAGKQDVRYYLNGMLIEKAGCGGAYLVATNGHAMLVVHDETAEVGDKPMIVPLPPLLVAQSKHARRVTFDGKRATLSGLAVRSLLDADDGFVLQIAAREIDGRYPNWRCVFPATEMAYGPACIANDVLRMLLAIRPGGADSRRSTRGNPILHVADNRQRGAGVVVARFSGFPHIVALLMPMRDCSLLPGVIPFAPAVEPAPAPTQEA